MKPAAATAMSVAPLRIAPDVATGRPVAVVVVIVCPLDDGWRFTLSGDVRQRWAGLGGTRLEVERVDRGVNQWPRSQPVLMCSTGPLGHSKVQRPTIVTAAAQAGWGQAIVSVGARWKVGSVIRAWPRRWSVDRPKQRLNILYWSSSVKVGRSTDFPEGQCGQGGGTMRACQPVADGYVERDGVKVCYEVFGAGEPTVLLLPTWSVMHSRHWKMQIPYLARHCRVLTFDGRGNGRSDRPTESKAYRAAE